MKKLLLFVLLTLLPLASWADGTVITAGADLRYTCNLPTTFSDGTPIPAGTPITLTAYATQNPPERGTVVGSGTGCPVTASSSGLPTGQYSAYLTATVEGHDESSLSNAVPFFLAPGPRVPAAAPELTGVVQAP